jgi:BirA family transcriptional regulator, biotin operon repressor / biotin---[acetyl-CoA-carboxylase] ligase
MAVTAPGPVGGGSVGGGSVGRPGIPDDLRPQVLAPLLGGRMVRVYPAVLSTEAAAQAWARAGGPDGGLIVADYQASPRGRGGLQWRVQPGVDLAFSLLLKPGLAAEDEGWLYTVVTSALADVLDGDAVVHWPDEVHGDMGRLAAVGVYADLQPGGVAWAVASALLPDVVGMARRRGTPAERGVLLARVLDAVEARCRQDRAAVLDDYRRRCATFGRVVRARLIPLGPAGPTIVGRAVDTAPDGALVLRTRSERRVAVRPQHLGLLEPADVEEVEPPDVRAALSRRARRPPRSPGGGPAPR